MVKPVQTEQISQSHNTSQSSKLARNQKARQKKKELKYIASLRKEANDDSSSRLKTGLQAFLSHGSVTENVDFNYSNVISTGKTRALKKKMKKLKKSGLDNQSTFKQMTRMKERLDKKHDRVVFNDKKQLKDRRAKRAKRSELNREKRKKQILQKLDKM